MVRVSLTTIEIPKKDSWFDEELMCSKIQSGQSRCDRSWQDKPTSEQGPTLSSEFRGGTLSGVNAGVGGKIEL